MPSHSPSRSRKRKRSSSNSENRSPSREGWKTIVDRYSKKTHYQCLVRECRRKAAEFNSLYNLRRHWALAHRRTVKRYGCTQSRCTVTFGTVHDGKKHLRDLHGRSWGEAGAVTFPAKEEVNSSYTSPRGLRSPAQHRLRSVVKDMSKKKRKPRTPLRERQDPNREHIIQDAGLDVSDSELEESDEMAEAAASIEDELLANSSPQDIRLIQKLLDGEEPTTPAPVSPAGVSTAMITPDMASPAGVSPAVVSPTVVSTAVVSPAVVSPAGVSPAVISPAVVSPAAAPLAAKAVTPPKDKPKDKPQDIPPGNCKASPLPSKKSPRIVTTPASTSNSHSVSAQGSPVTQSARPKNPTQPSPKPIPLESTGEDPTPDRALCKQMAEEAKARRDAAHAEYMDWEAQVHHSEVVHWKNKYVRVLQDFTQLREEFKKQQEKLNRVTQELEEIKQKQGNEQEQAAIKKKEALVKMQQLLSLMAEQV